MRVEQDVFEPMPELWEAEQLLEHKDNCTKCDKKYVLEAELKHHMALCHKKFKSSKLFTKAVPEKIVRVMSKDRIFIQGLPEDNVSMEDIAKVFSSVGALKRHQHDAAYMYHRKPSFTGKCTVTYELASDAAKAVNIFNGTKMFEGGRLTVEMAMVPLHIHAIEASRSRAGPSSSHQTTSKRQQAHWDPPHPHRLPPHLMAKCKENKCDLCLSWSPSIPSTLRATTWGGDTVCEWKRFSALTQLTLILVSQFFPPGGAGPSILIERTLLCPKKR